jgi:lysophospholipase L1-like esterase
LALRAQYNSFADALVDLDADSRLQDVNNKDTFVDGVHYTTNGYAIIASDVMPAIVRLRFGV